MADARCPSKYLGVRPLTQGQIKHLTRGTAAQDEGAGVSARLEAALMKLKFDKI
jgi:hypothetical protein